jgi:hypothetical protein
VKSPEAQTEDEACAIGKNCRNFRESLRARSEIGTAGDVTCLSHEVYVKTVGIQQRVFDGDVKAPRNDGMDAWVKSKH